MAEYIERQKVIDITAEMGALETQRRVQEIPAADVVEVVRCKDCAHVNVEVRDYAMYLPKQCELYCELDELPVKPDDFCSYGERKEDEPK